MEVQTTNIETKDQLDTSRIYILYTGGTIGMLYDKEIGLHPVKGNLVKLVEELKISNNINIEYTIERTKPLIDSSDLNTDNWKVVLDKLNDNYDHYDGFVVIHGTDTLAYTASALSYFLKDWKKTVVVTGSQIPLFEFRNDAKRNIIDSIIVSLHQTEKVLIVFGGKILAGNCSTKISSTDFIAYESPNIGPLGNLDVYVNMNYNGKVVNDNITHNHILEKKVKHWGVDQWNSEPLDIYEYSLLPIDNTKPLQALIDTKPFAIMLRTYGIGNAPVGNKSFMNVLKKGVDSGIIIVNVSQCLKGGVNMDYYKTGIDLEKIGIISGLDMTSEAVFGKLCYLYQLFGKDRSNIKHIKHLITSNICGEINISPETKKIRKHIRKYFKTYQEL